MKKTDVAGNALPPGMFYRESVGIYYVRTERGGVQQKRSTGKRDFKSALRRYHEIMKAWNDGDSGWDAKRLPTFTEYWADYREAYTVRKTPLPSGGYRDDQLVTVALKDLGRYRLDEFTNTMCQRWANKRRGMTYTKKTGGEAYALSEGTVTRELALLQAVFQQAIEDGHLGKNPWKRVEREAYATRERTLSESDQAKLEAALSPRYQRWLLFMLGTGLRLEECRGIDEKRDVDFVKRFVQVTRKSRGLKKKIQKVPLIDDTLLDVLQEQLTEDRDRLGRPTDQLWHQNQQRFREVLDQACERAGVDHISPHTLRHTFATRYLKAGGDIYVLSKILGHSSVAVTEKVYAHLLTEDLLLRSQGIKLGLRPRVLEFKKGA